MSEQRQFDQPSIYRIRVSGYLEERWSDWFDGMRIIPQPDGETLLTGLVTDQAALHGLLRKILDLGLPLLLVEWVETVPAPER